MARATKGKGFLILLFRGLLGGLIGGAFFAAVVVSPTLPNGLSNWLGWSLILFVSVGLPFSLIVGAALSTSIWLFNRETGIELGPLARVTIGTIVGIAVCSMAWSFKYQGGYLLGSLIADLAGLVMMGAALGGISGLIIGRQRSNAAVLVGKTADTSNSKVND